MGVDYPANLRKLAVEQCVRIQVARWTQSAFHDLAIEIGDDQIGRREAGVIDAAGLDYHQRFGA